MVNYDKKNKCYFCEECQMAYVDKKKACGCEEWCKKYKSCNLEIIKYSLKTKWKIDTIKLRNQIKGFLRK